MSEILRGVPGEAIRISTNSWTEPYWKAAFEGKLIVQKCMSCSTFRMPPGPFCPSCQSRESTWVTLAGKGELFSYTVCTKSPFPGKIPDFLHAPAVITLPDAGRIKLVGNLVEMSREEIRIGMTVDVVWNPTSDGRAVPWFRPAQG